MELPVLIRFEEGAFGRVSSFFSDPVVLLGGLLVVGLVVLALLRFVSLLREKRGVLGQAGPGPLGGSAAAESPELVGLREREARIKSMEVSAKSRKLGELRERESLLLQRQSAEKMKWLAGGGGVGGPEAASPPEFRGGDVSETRGEPARSEVFFEPPPAPLSERPKPAAGGGRPGLLVERDRLRKMIDIAAEKYERGELDREAFTRLETDYYKKLIDLEIVLRGEGED